MLRYWDLDRACVLASGIVDSDTTFVSMNPFNELQLITGSSTRAYVWSRTEHKGYGLPALSSRPLLPETGGPDDQPLYKFVSHVWASNSSLMLGGSGGELVLCDLAAQVGELR